MKYSRNKINIAGEKIVDDSTPVLEKSEAIAVIDDWRMNHLFPLEKLVGEVEKLLNAEGIKADFSSRRLKRMTSIEAKLKRNPNMRLGGLQDIGGARFVFNDVDSLFAAKKLVEKASLQNFSRVNKVRTDLHHLVDLGLLAAEPIDRKTSGYVRSANFEEKLSALNTEI